MELCKNRTEKSSLDLLNFYLISTGYDMVNDTDISTTCRSKFKAPPKKTTKCEVPLRKTWVAPNNRLMISDQKLKNLTLSIREQNKRTTRPQKQQLEMDLVTKKKQIKIILRGIQFKTVKTAARLHLIKLQYNLFFVSLLGHGKFNDTTNAATFRAGLQSPAVFPHFRGNML